MTISSQFVNHERLWGNQTNLLTKAIKHHNQQSSNIEIGLWWCTLELMKVDPMLDCILPLKSDKSS